MSDIEALVADLEAEQNTLLALVGAIDADVWLAPTPAWGWDVRDTIGHLADTDAMAIDTMCDGPDSLNKRVARTASGPDVTYTGVLKARRLPGADVAAWWSGTSQAVRDTLLDIPADMRIPWGIGMRPPSLVTARLMETWAHGLDVHAALGIEPVDTDRLSHVAWIATRALPYAYTVAEREMPSAPLRIELTLPSGAAWSTGPEDAPDRVSGPAGDYCRVFVQRRRVADTSLVIEGDAALDAMRVARAYL